MALNLHEPPSGVAYTEVLTVSDAEPRIAYRGLIGALLGLAGFILLTPVVSSLVLWGHWLSIGSPGEFVDYQRAGLAMEFPAGMAAAHIGLAMLIPISFGLIVFWHHLRGRWLNSVQPGFRWRYAIICFFVAVIVINLMLWGSSGFQIGPINPQPNAMGFIVVILLTAPLQAAAEEYFFRGYLLQAIASMGRNRWLSVGVTALAFALFHSGTEQGAPAFVYRLGFGLLAGCLVVLTGGLEAAIAAHVVNNLCVFIYAALTDSVAKANTTADTTWGPVVWTLVAFAAVGALSWLIGKRMNLATTTP